MKAVARTTKVFLDWRFLVLGLLLVFAPLSRAQTQVYSDDQLVRIGNDDYIKGDYISASLFLFAYIQKKPALMTSKPDFANQVQRNWQFSRDQVWKAWNDRARLEDNSSTSAGLTQAPPPPLKIPPQ
jgi:hypothetical protein